MFHVEVSSKRVHYKFTLRKKITVIRGNSGVGKTVLVDALIDDSGAYTISQSDEHFEFREVTGRRWYDFLDGFIETSTNKVRYVFLLDDTSLLGSVQLARLIAKDKFNYYIFIDRYDFFNTAPLPVDEVYSLKGDDAGNHWLEPHQVSWGIKEI